PYLLVVLYSQFPPVLGALGTWRVVRGTDGTAPPPTGVPGGGARGSKAGKGAGGGVGRYGYRGVSNAESYEVTWEDIVLAMELSAMCFGALLALCIVACCAYKICGPAEEEDWGSRYSVLKPPQPRLAPELLREIYTLPSATSSVTRSSSKPLAAATVPPTVQRQTAKAAVPASVRMEGLPRETSVKRATVPEVRVASYGQLPNGRPGEPLLDDIIPAAPPRPQTPRSVRLSAKKSPRLLNIGSILEGRPRLLTLPSLSSSRAARQQAGRGAANRLAEYNQTSSTLDIARAAAATIPNLHYTHRSLSDPHTAVV
ncbi:uncharacterized protein, partial [Cherax quadricarinatus]|uniref:uncharacterized protein n=1 Tax=Cherax quadricarinatus TaxID=27406 RepID=UPI002379FD85